MNAVDAMVLALLALADIALLIHIRRRRARGLRVRRMDRALTLAVRRELAVGAPAMPVPGRRRPAAVTVTAMLNRHAQATAQF